MKKKEKKIIWFGFNMISLFQFKAQLKPGLIGLVLEFMFSKYFILEAKLFSISLSQSFRFLNSVTYCIWFYSTFSFIILF